MPLRKIQAEVMKALSVRQPWAWAIVQGFKKVENRSRRTKHRGPLLIHASLNFDKKGLEYIRSHMGIPVPDHFDCGGIVGMVKLVDVVTEHPSDFFFGPYGYVLTGAKPMPFRPCKGKLGFWEYTR